MHVYGRYRVGLDGCYLLFVIQGLLGIECSTDGGEPTKS